MNFFQSFLKLIATLLGSTLLFADDWYNRGVKKQNSRDNQGAIEDYNQGISIDTIAFIYYKNIVLISFITAYNLK